MDKRRQGKWSIAPAWARKIRISKFETEYSFQRIGFQGEREAGWGGAMLGLDGEDGTDETSHNDELGTMNDELEDGSGVVCVICGVFGEVDVTNGTDETDETDETGELLEGRVFAGSFSRMSALRLMVLSLILVRWVESDE
jgi:hypothetical protein